jgi:DNA-binding IclR family transcriptional regulator
LKLLKQHPAGLTIDEIANMLDLTPSTVYQRLRELFFYQLVVEVHKKDEKLFRLTEYDISVDSSASARSTRGEL